MTFNKDLVLEAEHGLIAGIRNGDVAFLDRILHDELLFIAPNGQVITKQMDLDSHKRGDMVVESLTPAFEAISILGDTAVVVVAYDTKGSMLGNPIEGKFRYIRIWKAFDDGLKVIGGSCSMLN